MCSRLVSLVLVGLVLGTSGPAMAGMIVAGELLVDLRAEDLLYGPATNDWVNHGTLGGFEPQGTPIVEDVGGRKAATFNGGNYFVGPTSVSAIEGAGSRSIEVWAYNPSFSDEETMVHWSHRGGPDGSNMAFNYGSHTTWGAAAHWGPADMGWAGSHSPAPAANTWWHLAYTYDGTTVRIYVNGELETSRVLTLNTYAGCPIRIAAQGNDSGQGTNAASAFSGSIAEVRIHTGVLSASDVANNFRSKPNTLGAGSPNPSNGATDFVRDGVVNWKPGESAAAHDVYFGTAFDDVNTASRTSPKGVLASQGQTATTFDPTGLLDFGQTYYWRVDEVNGAPDYTISKGDVWRFTAETYGYRIDTPIKATASSFSNALAQPDKTIDGSGIDALDQHSLSATQMWLSKKNVTPIWIQYEFDAVYSLHQMWVWNQNQMSEPDNGVGAKDVIIEVSTDGTTWTALEGVPEFAQGTGEPNYVHNTTVDFGGVSAKYVKLTITSNWADGTKQAGLSEVRFFYVPVKAFGPTPATGASEVAVDGALNWRPGRTAASHEVYLGTDPNALTKVGTMTGHSYSLTSAGAEYDRTYYWKVDEVDDAQTPKTWEGDVWSFSTPGAFVVDDFESYNDNCNRVYYTWVDGYGATTAPECGAVTIAGNGSGSAVGNQSAPYAERTNSHGGNQSMPLFYDNPGASSYSEATRTFAVGQDWVQGGVKTLVLYFYGASDNAAGQLYVKVNNTKVVYNGKSDVLTIPMWRQWNIDLASVGGALRSVTTLAVGVSGTGKGLVLIDDIQMYRDAPAVAVPTDPGTTGLSAYYTFEGDVKDTSGKGNHGTANGDPMYTDSLSGLGKALLFDGINDHVDLPIGTLISTLTSATFASWVNVSPLDAAWPRIFDFGKGNTDYIQLTPHQGTDGPLTCDIRINNVETRFAAARILPTGWHHVAVVVDGAAMTIKVYQDGTVVAEGSTPVLPKDLGVTNQNWLGRSQWTADAYFVGQLDEFRIYNRALAEAEVRYLVGDR